MKKNGGNKKNGSKVGGNGKTVIALMPDLDVEIVTMGKKETIADFVDKRVKVSTEHVVIVTPYSRLKEEGADAIRNLRKHGTHVRVAFIPEEKDDDE